MGSTAPPTNEPTHVGEHGADVLGQAMCSWPGALGRVLHVTRLTLNYAYMLSLAPPPLGATVTIVLRLGDCSPLPPIQGRVVSTSLDPADARNCGFGLVFTSIPSTALAALCSTLDRIGLPSAPPPGPDGERRTEPRIWVGEGVRARLQTSDEAVQMKVANLSLGGALLTHDGSPSPQGLSPGTTLSLELMTEGWSEVVSLRASVVRITHAPEPTGIGVRFVKLTDAARAGIEGVLLRVLGRLLLRGAPPD